MSPPCLAQAAEHLRRSAMFLARVLQQKPRAIPPKSREFRRNLRANFARDTRTARSNADQKAETDVARHAVPMDSFRARVTHRARTFGAEIAQFCDRIFLKIMRFCAKFRVVLRPTFGF